MEPIIRGRWTVDENGQVIEKPREPVKETPPQKEPVLHTGMYL